MVSTVLFNKSDKYIISKDYIQYLLKLEALNYLKRENLINEQMCLDAKLQLQNLYIRKK